jgi:uncharacterized protein HemX
MPRLATIVGCDTSAPVAEVVIGTLSTSAKAVSWTCFGLGIALVVAGVVYGFVVIFWKQPQKAKQKAEQNANEAKATIDALANKGLVAAKTKGVSVDAVGDIQQTRDEAKAKVDEAKDTVLGDIGSIIGSLPEALRFPGLMILVGTVLMSVAAVQFGGHSIF